MLEGVLGVRGEGLVVLLKTGEEHTLEGDLEGVKGRLRIWIQDRWRHIVLAFRLAFLSGVA